MYYPKIVIIISGLLLSGCVSLAPQYLRPDLQIPDTIENESIALANGMKTKFTTPSWKAFITDSQMQQTIQLALNKNNDLYLAALDVEEARLRFGISAVEKYPQVMSSLGGEYSRSLNGGSSLEKKYSTGVDISYELDFFGRIKNLSEADKASFLASQAMNRATQIITIKTVAEAYLDVVYNQQLLLIAQDTKTNYLNSQSIVKQKVLAGQANISDLEQARGQVQSIDITIEKIKSDIARNENLVDFLTNNYSQKIGFSLSLYQPIAVPSDIPSEILLKRPDVMAAEQGIVSQNANIGVARAAFFPSISFNSSITSGNDSLSGLFDSSNGIWNFLPKITLPIFTGGKNSKNLDLAIIRKNKAIANYEKSIQVAFREVKDALTMKSSLQKQLVAQENYVNTLSNILAQKQASYRYGGLSYLNVLDAQRDLFTAKQNLLLLNIEQQKNEINLFSALGGGLIE